MMHVTLLTVGKLKEPHLRGGCEEYQKRLSAFCRLTVCELPECKLPDAPSPAEIQEALRREGEALLARIPAKAAVVALCIEGKELSSQSFSELLEDFAVSGKSQVAFLIGGSWGLCEQVKGAAAFQLSLSRMTFPHQLARMLLLEQIYRGFSIANNGKYHK